MTTDTFLPYGKQSIAEEDIEAVREVMGSDFLTRGPKVEEFERAVADYCGAKYAVAFSNGTTALMAAAFAAKMGPHDRFITTPNTFVATTGAGLSRGSSPVYVDIDLETGNLDLEQVNFSMEQEMTRGKNVIIPVHFSGIAVDMSSLQRGIKQPNTVVIEDAAHAIGSSYIDGSRVGSCTYSDMTTFSFHPVKTITSGEGGMVTTNREELFDRLRLFRNNGIERDPKNLKGPQQPWYYEVKEITGNYHLTDIQSAIGLSQLSRLDQIVLKRRELVQAYRAQLKDVLGVRLFTDKFDAHTAFHLMVLQIEFEKFGMTRTELMNQLREKGIGTGLHYIPVYRHPFFTEKKGDISDYFPNMEQYYRQALSFPLFYEMTVEDVERVVKELNSILTCAN